MQLRDWSARFREHGARLVVIGNGSLAHATAFRDQYQLDFELLTDPERSTYQAAELRRGWHSLLDVRMYGRGLLSMLRGFLPGWTQGDALQQGGAFVITPDNKVLFEFVSQSGGDHPDPAAMLGVVANTSQGA